MSSEKNNIDAEVKVAERVISPRLAIRPGFEYLEVRHSNRYPLDITPEVDSKKFSDSLGWMASFG